MQHKYMHQSAAGEPLDPAFKEKVKKAKWWGIVLKQPSKRAEEWLECGQKPSTLTKAPHPY